MKIINYIPGLVTFILILSGCQSLDQEIITDLNYDQVTSSYDMTKYRCASVYATIPSGFQLMGNAMMSSVTDESEHTNETSSVQIFNSGSVNPYNNPDNVWGDYFIGIRKANQFLASSDSVDLDLYKYDPAQQAVYISRSAEIKNWKYEVRFLRAYFYFELIKRYGGLPILTTAGPIDGDYSNIERNTLAECIKFIVDECDSAAAMLPLKYTLADDLGRITKGAALALKSRMLLYAASDLFNNPSWAQGYGKPELISITGDRQAKWKSAADAAKAVIDVAAASGLSLSNNYGALFGPTTHTNAEVIFCRRYGSTNAFEIQNTPIGFDKGKSGTTPSQNLIDDYEVKVNATSAVPFDWSNPNHAANPYATSGPTARDPRLNFTVLTNNAVIKDRPIETFIGGLDGKPIYQATKTGYYLRKYNNVDLNLTTGTTSVHSYILIRLAEIYLNYAEALNEYNPGNPDIKLYVDKVRQRASVVMPPLPAGLNQEQMREAIRHERRIELAFEDHRFWDLKRWMTAPDVLNEPLKGIEISKNSDLTFSYNIINVENRVFEPKMYFYPIPRSELFITQWDQNPLW